MEIKNEKILYVILDEINKGNRNFDHNDFEIGQEKFMDILRYADKEDYIDNVFYADDIVYYYGDATITSKGKEYLKINNKWTKVYKTIKEAHNWLKI